VTQAIIYRAMLGVLLGSLVLMGAYQQAEGRLEGEVRSVDSGSGTLTLSGGNQLAVDLGTVVRKDGNIASFRDIKEGDQLRASFLPSLPWLLGHRDALQDKVKEVLVNSRATSSESVAR
jgi:hypothetical protein